MDMLRELLWRLEGSSWFLALPEALRQPPGIYALGVGALVLVLLVLYAISTLVFGREKRGPNVDRRARKQLKRDIAELRRHGNHEELGRLYESLGHPKKALQAYRKGGVHERRVALLIDMGRKPEALKVARDGGAWRQVGELAREAEDFEEAATAFERAGQVYEAAQCWDRLDRPLESARCYVAAGLETEAIKRLDGATGREAAELLESALRAAIGQVGPGLSLEQQASVRRAVQLWLGEGQAERAFRLAVDAGQPALAVPVARDYLEPSREAAEVCVRADAPLVAAEIYERLGDLREAALQRAEHFRRHDDPRSAAEQFEKAEEWNEAAEQWAVAGEAARAAEIYASHGDLQTAAALYGQAGDTARQQEILSRVRSIRPAASDGDPTPLGGGPAEPRAPVANPIPRADLPGARPTVAAAPGGAAHSEAPSLTGSRFPFEPRSDFDPTVPLVTSPSPESPAATQPAGQPTREVVIPADPTAVPTAPSRPASPGAPAPAPSAAESGEARYRMIEQLGRGGMGAVYLAEDLMLRRQVAYKIVPENILGTEIEPETLLEEARAAARLSHTNIVQVYDVGRHGQGFFVVMELVRGQNLDAILSEQRMSIIGAIRVGRQVCAALAHAHERRIIHRDLKPSNLMWDGKRVRLTDFGLARAFEEGVGKVATQPAGTPSYMAPEQIRGEDLSPQADIYAFGCLLFEMLCQKPVFGTGPASFHHHLSTAPADPRQHRPEVPTALAALVLRCLAKNPMARPASAAEIGRELGAMVKDSGPSSGPARN